MQAQRKLTDPAPNATPSHAVPLEPIGEEALRQTEGERPTSPAILLQEELAARLAEPQGTAAAIDPVTVAAEYKLPMALRIATIVGLSLVLWGGIVVLAVAVIT